MSTLFNDSPECRALPYYFTALEAAVAFDAFQKRMAKEYPGAWPWPVSGMVSPVHRFNPDPQASMQHHNQLNQPSQQSATTEQPAKPANPHDFLQEHFDTEAHRRFMRGLG